MPGGDIPARCCGECSLCCKLLGIEELAKPLDTWCANCRPGQGGCGIYESRPDACRSYSCLWLLDDGLGEAWRPDRTGFVLYLDEGGRRLVIHVDPARPESWRVPACHAELRRWATGSMLQLVVLENGTITPLA